jgi:hypothetical protein
MFIREIWGRRCASWGLLAIGDKAAVLAFEHFGANWGD